MTTRIEWTDETWNPVTGCTKVSQGCKHCYAERLWPKVEGARVKREGGAPRPFTEVRCHMERLEVPLHWHKPRRIFVNSMSDLFHDAVPDRFIADVFGIMMAAHWHTFQVLTKRQQRMHNLLSSSDFGQMVEDCADLYSHHSETMPLPNVWLGVSVEDQPTADERIPLLMQTPAAVRFISAEPLLGSIALRREISSKHGSNPCAPESWQVTDWLTGWTGTLDHHRRGGGHSERKLDQVIAGGESGPQARPSHPDWFRFLRDQCQAAGVAFFFKQWGTWYPEGTLHEVKARAIGDRRTMFFPGLDYAFSHWSKRMTGRLLDGREWNEYPR